RNPNRDEKLGGMIEPSALRIPCIANYNPAMRPKKADSRRTSKSPTHYTWRKLSAAKWEDVWVDRLSEVADRLAITALAGAKTIRLEAFQLTRTQAERLRTAFGGTVAAQKKQRAVSGAVRAPIRVRERLIIV